MYQAAIDKAAARGLIREKYGNFIGGKWVAPVEGRYFDNPSPITGKRLCSIPRSSHHDIELALDAAHAAKDAWGRTSVAERANVLLKIADRMEANLDLLALVETLDNGKPIRETTHADLPLASIIGVISPAPARPGRRRSARSTTTRSPITSTSRSASSARSSPGTSRC